MRQDEQICRTGCLVAGQLVVLDCAASRYFLAPDASVQSRSAPPHPLQTIVLRWTRDAPIRRDTAREGWVTRARTDVGDHDGTASLRTLIRLRVLEWRYAKILRSGGLNAGLETLSAVSRGDDDRPARATLIGTAQGSRRLWSARDRCLPRALAIAHALRAFGGVADVVLGVTLHPFAAHAWVQEGDTVLSDAIDQVRLFTPILVA